MDAGFLYMESATNFGHVSSLAIYERPDDPDFDPYEAAQQMLASQIDKVEPYRRRVVEVPFGIDRPYWIEDPDFDLEYHLRHLALPAPGNDEQLANQVARIIGRPCDRSRPLWEAYVIEGLGSMAPPGLGPYCGRGVVWRPAGSLPSTPRHHLRSPASRPDESDVERTRPAQ